MTRIRFLGGASTVTGSKFLVESKGHRVLIDGGMFQGRRLEPRNWKDQFQDRRPHEVLITHAHIDHTGWLPRLVGTVGFDGPIRATAATADLMGVMLPDAARLQEEQAAYANKKGFSKHRPALPLYTEADAAATLELLRPVGYGEWVDVAGGRARFTFAGHILGSAHIELETANARIVFSGDVGKWDVPVIKDPVPPPQADLVVLESTYGDRLHDAAGDLDASIAALFDTIGETGGILLIPAFSIGRTQELLYRIRAMEASGRIPSLPVFLDSPMALDATVLYRRHHEEHDLEMEQLRTAGAGPLHPAQLSFTRSVPESKRLNGMQGPAVIIAASGMATGGRIVHHLKRLLPVPSTIVAFVGYQAQGTRGRVMVDGADRVRIHGRMVPIRATVLRLDAFSAHADRHELLRWLREAAGPPHRVALVHGEDRARRALAAAIGDDLGLRVHLPRQGGVLDL